MSAIASVVMDNDGSHVTITLDNGGSYRRQVQYEDSIVSIIPNTGQEKVLDIYYDTSAGKYIAIRTDGGDQATEDITEGLTSDHGLLTGLLDDDHTQYRLESTDHTHQTTGAQAGKLDHGLVLNGLTDDDHTQYLLATGVRALSGNMDVTGKQLTNQVLHVVANSTVRDALTPLVGKIVWQTDEGHPYVCTVV